MPRRKTEKPAPTAVEVIPADAVEVLPPIDEQEEKESTTKTKIPTVRIESDDCAVSVGGIEYFMHVDEWIDVVPGLIVGEVGVMKRSRELGPALAAIEGDDDEAEEQVVLVSGNLDEALAMLREKVIFWNWTDKVGRPLPQPIDDPDVFARLHTQEIYYLVRASMGETEGAEKND